MATQVLYRPACSLHHVAFQLIAVLRRLSDVLQGRVCHTSPEEIDTNPSASFPASDRSHTYNSSRSFLSASSSSSLTEYLSSAGLLPVHQSAYRKCHSTETALLKVVTDLTQIIY